MYVAYAQYTGGTLPLLVQLYYANRDLMREVVTFL